ncbi:hypothetical protein KEM52_002782, partial [Ascosphaera acerosa]
FDGSMYESAGMQRHSARVPVGFYARLTRDIVALSLEDGLGVDGRIVSVLEGGYSDRALASGVLSHLSGLAATEALPPMEDGIAHAHEDSAIELTSHIKQLSLHDERRPFVYHPEWWSIPCIEQLEQAIKGPVKKAPVLKRQKTPPTYCSPTQASAAKAVAPPPEGSNRMASWLIVGDLSPQEVDWCTATRELHKLLVPVDRSVRSYTHRELRAKAVSISARQVKEAPEPHAMTLRNRRTRTPSPPPPVRRAVSRRGDAPGAMPLRSHTSMAHRRPISSDGPPFPNGPAVVGVHPSLASRRASTLTLNLNAAATAGRRESMSATRPLMPRAQSRAMHHRDIKSSTPMSPRVAQAAGPPPSSQRQLRQSASDSAPRRRASVVGATSGDASEKRVTARRSAPEQSPTTRPQRPTPSSSPGRAVVTETGECRRVSQRSPRDSEHADGRPVVTDENQRPQAGPASRPAPQSSHGESSGTLPPRPEPVSGDAAAADEAGY